MPVFQATVANAATGKVPAPADRFDGFDRANASLREPVKRVPTRPTRLNQRQFFDAKVFRLTLELHRTGVERVAMDMLYSLQIARSTQLSIFGGNGN